MTSMQSAAFQTPSPLTVNPGGQSLTPMGMQGGAGITLGLQKQATSGVGSYAFERTTNRFRPKTPLK